MSPLLKQQPARYPEHQICLTFKDLFPPVNDCNFWFSLSIPHSLVTNLDHKIKQFFLRDGFKKKKKLMEFYIKGPDQPTQHP